MARYVNFDAIRNQLLESDSTKVTMPDGSEITIPPLVLWPDDAGMDADGVRRVLGETDGDQYLAAGGTAAMLSRLAREGQRAEDPESDASPES